MNFRLIISSLIAVSALAVSEGFTQTTIQTTVNDEMITGTKARQLIQEEGAIIVDVRTPAEYTVKHVPGALHFPLQTLAQDYYHFGDFERPIVIYCRSGNRSGQAIEFLAKAGFTKLYNMGPLENWDK